MSAAAARRRKQKAKQSATTSTENLDDRVSSLLSSPDTPSHYEALQLLTSNVHRLLKTGSVPKALQTAQRGTLTLLSHQHVEIASQLSGMYVEALRDTRTIEDEGVVRDIMEISEGYGKCYVPGKEGDEKKTEYHLTYLKSTLKYSSSLGPITLGNLTLHKTVGEIMWKSGDRILGSVHLAISESPGTIVSSLFSDDNDVGGRERDEIVMVAGVNFAVMGNLRDAMKMVIGYKVEMEKRVEEPTRPAVFIIWLLEIIRRKDAGRLFKWLIEQFKEVQMINKDMPGLLQRIGKVYFGLTPPPNMMNMLEAMMGGGM